MEGIVVNFDSILVFMLIMMRMTGMLVFHPIFARSNVPIMVNAVLAFMLALLLTGHVPTPDLPTDLAIPTYLLMVFKELLIGIFSGFLMRMFLSVLIVSGEMVDMQLGISMSKAFDPGSNTSISLSAQIYTILFMLVFFVTNSHLTFILLTAQTFEVLPLGTYLIDFNAFYLLPELLGNILLLAAKLSLPIVIIEIIVTFASGIIMRIIPQINVFVINIQLKLLVGIFVLMFLVPPFTAFMENIIAICLENIQGVWAQLPLTPPT